MKYKNPELKFHHGCVLCSIPRLFVYLHMRMSTSKIYCEIAFEQGYLWVSPVLRLHLCAGMILETQELFPNAYFTNKPKCEYVPLFMSS